MLVLHSKAFQHRCAFAYICTAIEALELSTTVQTPTRRAMVTVLGVSPLLSFW